MEILGLCYINMFKASDFHCFKNCGFWGFFFAVSLLLLFSFCLHASSKDQIWLVYAHMLALFWACRIVHNTQ